MDDSHTPSSDLQGDDLPEDLRARIKAELAPGERLIWAARAVRGPAAWGANPIVLLGWVVGSWGVVALALGYAFGLFGPKSDVPVPLITLAGALAGLVGVGTTIGLVGTISARLSGRDRATRTAYALTDRRAIVWKPKPGTAAVEVLSCPQRSLLALRRVEFPDGSGDVVFQGNELYWGLNGFEGIAEVRRVEALAREVLVDPDPPRDRRRRDEFE